DHTMTHPDLTTLSNSQVISELKGQLQLSLSITGQQENLFRPAYGRHNATTDSVANGLGLTEVSWTYSPGDANSPAPTPDAIAAGVLANVRDGSIILVHDGHPNTLTALPRIIAGLKAKGLAPGRILPSATPIADYNGDPMYVKVVPW